MPDGLWSAPVPLIGVAPDWHVLWHYYRRRLPSCDLILTDAVGAEVMRREGFDRARAVPLWGCERQFFEPPPEALRRDIDVLFVGNWNPALHQERLAWLGRLAAVGRRWRVALRTAVFGPPYVDLLRRARVVFSFSSRGLASRRVAEAIAAGAVVFQEAGNRELSGPWRAGEHFIAYTADDLESLLDHYLTHEDERLRVVQAAREHAAHVSFESQWAGAVAHVEREWADLKARAARRGAAAGSDELPTRTWKARYQPPSADPTLAADLEQALSRDEADVGLGHALAWALARQPDVPRASEAVERFQRLLEKHPGHLLAGLNLAETLARCGRTADAIDRARRTLAVLETRSEPDLALLDAVPVEAGCGTFRVEWERAAWRNAGDRPAELRAKTALVRWQLHFRLAQWTNQLAHFYEAVLARPDLWASGAALGNALVSAGHPAESLSHLRQRLSRNPFDRAAAFSLYEALGALGCRAAQAELAGQRRLLAGAAPGIVPAERWFAEPAAAPAEFAPRPHEIDSAATRSPDVSLCVIARDEESHLPACLASAAGLFGEVVVVDTGSTDRTREVARRFGARVFDFPWVDDFSAARNECLRHARGRWIMWLDADDRLDEENRGRLRGLFVTLGDGKDAYVLKVRSPMDAGGQALRVLDQVRIFPNHPQVRWEYRVHEQILPSVRRAGGGVRWADVVIDHGGYVDPAVRRGKLERNLRLLELDVRDRPDDPFTLFNRGWTLLDVGRTAEAMPHLERSLANAEPDASIVRKLYGLIVQAHRRLGAWARALRVCEEGLARFPDDSELLQDRADLAWEAKDLATTEACLLRLIEDRPARYFASIDDGLRGYRTRHRLGCLYRDQVRLAEAEAQWRRALAERPTFLPAWHMLGDLLWRQERWSDLADAARGLEEAGYLLDADVLRARACLARREFTAARAVLGSAIQRHPDALGPRVLLTHVLLQEDGDPAGAEAALHDVLHLAPDHAEARHNLAVLLQRRR